MWWVILILVVVIVVLWWLLRQNAQETETPIHEEQAEHIAEATKVEEVPATLEVRSEPIHLEPAKPDDLTIIEGIGPKISSIFQQAGILTFAQLADEEPTRLKKILENAGLRLGDPTSWPKQAKLAADGDWDGLKALQDSLKGGRVV